MLETGYEHQHLFTKVFENAPIGMALISPNGRFMKVNQSLCKMLGYSEAELTGLTFQLITHQDDLEENMDLRQKTISGEIDSYRIEKRYVHKSGKLIWGLLNATVERDTRGNLSFYISQIVDITEQKIREEKIREAEKLSLVGELAAGIAHEIRNPLTSLRGFVQLYQTEDKNNKRKLRNEVMLSEIDRINEIVSELLVLAKPTEEKYELAEITVKLNQVMTLFEAQANLYNVQFIKELDPELPSLHCHNSLNQVFINILKNAIESMPDGGEVRIEARKREENLYIRFMDQGCGIPQDQLAKIGSPFYTTKEQGTGLGIMVSQRIVQNHKGTMRIESEVGKGSTVEIILPIS